MKRRNKRAEIKTAGAVLLVAVAATLIFTVWYAYHSADQANKAYSSQPAPAVVTDAKRQPNVVADPQNGSADLVAFLRADDTGCWRSNDRGWYRVVKEVNGNQAEMEYGCSKTYNMGNGTPARILAHKVDGVWKLISPTNQWDYTIPSCAMLQANDILATLEPACWTKQTNAGTTVVGNQNSQYADSYATCTVAPDSTVTKSAPAACITKDHVVFAQ